MLVTLRLTQWGNSIPFNELLIDLSVDGLCIVVGHPPPGAMRTAAQCWLEFEVIEFDHAKVWRQGDKVSLTMTLYASYSATA
jgi:hypothetical protein